MIGDGDEHAEAAGIRILRGHVEQDPFVIKALAKTKYRPVPTWLGDFKFKIYGWAYGRDYGSSPHAAIVAEELKLRRLVEDQRFTTTFVQKYLPGQNVRPHRDPKNNLGHTVIALYGDFTPTRLRVGEHWFVQRPGDVFVLPCTIAGQQGPEHEMLWESGLVLPSGTRYAIILNTLSP